MRVRVRVVPNAKQPSLAQVEDGTLVICVTAPAREGRANAAVIEAVAEHFGVPKRAVTIRQGLASRQKVLEIV